MADSGSDLTDVGEYLMMLAELDVLFLNEDRHTNNLTDLFEIYDGLC